MRDPTATPAPNAQPAGTQPATAVPAQGQPGGQPAHAVPTPAPAPTATPAATPAPAAQPQPITAAALKLPQGLDAQAAEQVAQLAGALKWTPDQAQAFLDHQAATLPARQEAAVQAVQAQADAWLGELKAHAIYGGERFTETTRCAGRAMDAMMKAGYITQDERAFLDSTGYGNHPILVKLAAELGRAMREDTFGGGTSSPSAPKSDAQLFYGSPAA